MQRSISVVHVVGWVAVVALSAAAAAALAVFAPWLLLGLAACVAVGVVTYLAASGRAAVTVAPPQFTPAPPISPESLNVSYRVLVVGPTGHGKTMLGLSLLATLSSGTVRQLARLLGVSLPLRVQYDNAARHKKTERTPATDAAPPATPPADEFGFGGQLPLVAASAVLPGERLLVRLRRKVVEVLFHAGEDLYLPDGSIDVDRLLARMRQVGARRVLLITNPFRINPRLARRALLDLARNFNERKFPLGRSVELAAELLFGISRKALARLGVGYQRLGEVLRDARVRYEATGRTIEEQFPVEGVPPAAAARIHQVLERIADTVVEQSVEASVVSEVAARVGKRCCVVATHADVLPFLRSVSELDLRKAVQGVFPTDRPLRNTQVILQGSQRLELSNDPKEPVWVRGPSPEATELLESLAAELRVQPEVARAEADYAPRFPAHALLPSANGTGQPAARGGTR